MAGAINYNFRHSKASVTFVDLWYEHNDSASQPLYDNGKLSRRPPASVLDTDWQQILGDQDPGLDKLEHLLQRIAPRLIQVLAPQGEAVFVFTPEMMQRYYAETELERHAELYPWPLVFDDETSSISRLMRDRDVQVEHHLIQMSHETRPNVPGLTYKGWVTWMLLLIRAHPEHELERLEKTLRLIRLADLGDGNRELLAAIRQKLFPLMGDTKRAERLSQLMETHCQVSSKFQQKTAALATRANSQVKGLGEPFQPTVEDVADDLDHRRNQSAEDSEGEFAPNYGHAQSSMDCPPAQSIPERTRRPYSRQPAHLKQQEAISTNSTSVRTQSSMRAAEGQFSQQSGNMAGCSTESWPTSSGYRPIKFGLPQWGSNGGIYGQPYRRTRQFAQPIFREPQSPPSTVPAPHRNSTNHVPSYATNKTKRVHWAKLDSPHPSPVIKSRDPDRYCRTRDLGKHEQGPTTTRHKSYNNTHHNYYSILDDSSPDRYPRGRKNSYRSTKAQQKRK